VISNDLMGLLKSNLGISAKRNAVWRVDAVQTHIYFIKQTSVRLSTSSFADIRYRSDWESCIKHWICIL